MVTRYVFRLYLFAFVLLVGFVGLVMRLWTVQIDGFKKYASAVPQTGTVTQRLPGIRGEIKDRNGVPLAVNDMTFEIKLDLKELVEMWKEAHANDKPKVPDIPTYEYTVNEDGRKVVRKATDIFAIYDEIAKPQLERMNLFEKINSKDLRAHYLTNRGVIPYTYKQQISFDDLAIAAEQSRFLRGVRISKRAQRRYPWGALASHIMGYPRLADDSVPREETRMWQFYEGDEVGVAGVESSLDRYLRAKPGKRVLLRDEHYQVRSDKVVEQVDPVRGSDVYLTIDLRMQYIAALALREAGVGRGAAVVLDPNNGEVLAMASVPDFDPNRFVPSIDPDEWLAIERDPFDSLTNRAMQAYPPGSTFKIPVALAGCVAGQAGQYYNCAGSVTYGNKAMKCWIAEKGGTHGTLGLSDAIMQSCNCYFYKYGNDTGIENIAKVTKWFGLGDHTGIELGPEASGLVPSPKWLALTHPDQPNWGDARTANTSIGQGEVLATPLQMASVAATVANGGKCYKPKLLRKLYDSGDKAEIAMPERLVRDLQDEGVKSNSIELVRKGMWKVVNGEKGTAKKAQVVGKDIVAGKTGTAQAWRWDDEAKENVKDNKTWFMCFAPYDKPQFAVCVFVEHGKGGGTTSAPIAARILKQCMAVAAGTYDPKPQPLQVVKGHFNEITEVAYKDDPVAPIEAADGDEAISESAPSVASRPRTSSKVAKPKIKVKADEAGSRGRNQAPSQQTPQPEKKNFLQKLFGN